MLILFAPQIHFAKLYYWLIGSGWLKLFLVTPLTITQIFYQIYHYQASRCQVVTDLWEYTYISCTFVIVVLYGNEWVHSIASTGSRHHNRWLPQIGAISDTATILWANLGRTAVVIHMENLGQTSHNAGIADRGKRVFKKGLLHLVISWLMCCRRQQH